MRKGGNGGAADLPLERASERFRPLIRSLAACAVRRHGLSVGANPTRQLSFQPEAIGAVVEVTKRLEHSGVEGHEKVAWRVHRPNASKR